MIQQSETLAIEERIARDRARLSASLDELYGRASPDYLAREALGMAQRKATNIARPLAQTARAHPLLLAAAGAGVVWLIANGRKSWAQAPLGQEDDGDAEDASLDLSQDSDSAWFARIGELRDRASAVLHDLEERAQSGAEGVRDFAEDRRKVIAAFASDMSEALHDGLDGLPDAARERVVAAREAAYEARLKLERGVGTGKREADRLVREHPMIAGAIAMVMGAAVAAALPRTRFEKHALGKESLRLMALAAALARTERDAADSASRTSAKEAEPTVKEEAKDKQSAEAAEKRPAQAKVKPDTAAAV